MDRNVCVLGGGMSKWGVGEGSQRDFFQEAAKACYDVDPVPQEMGRQVVMVPRVFYAFEPVK